jgi:diaminohydroxyphosphoribosylaminopyrimidine deaminase / 5-amino-6-(5-phosphoribosylamino)uracil reductase
MVEENYMNRSIELALKGAGLVAPNPMVGAVLVHNTTIIGEGWHQQYGLAHAEVNCINDAIKKGNKDLISQSTLYVSLEPCSHFGKTPPCADLIVKHKIPTVVVGCRDPFIEVNGKGIEKLEAAGVQVITGVQEKACKELNKRFFTFHQQKRPYIILKWAETADGFIAGKNSSPRLFISNEQSNRKVHQWRSEEAAILVGTSTALNDDPELTTRLWPGASPVRLVLDIHLKLPVELKLFNREVKTIVFNTIKNEEENNLRYYKIKKEGNIPLQIMQALYELQVQSVIVEGGGILLTSFIAAGLWDEARIIRNNSLLANDGLKAPVFNGTKVQEEKSGNTDTISVYLHN